MRKPIVAVVYDSGAAGPGNILAASRGLCDVLFLIKKPATILGDLAVSLVNNRQVLEVGEDLNEIAATLKAMRVDAITTFSEQCLELTTTLADAAGLRYHSKTSTRLLTDKVEQRAALRRANLDETLCIRVQSPEDLDTALAQTGLPAILKPVRGFGSQGVTLVESTQEAFEEFALLSRYGDLLVEQYLPGSDEFRGEPWADCITIESWVSNGTVNFASASGRLPFAPPFREQGIFVPACVPSPQLEAAVALAVSAHEALDIKLGVTHIEIKFTPSGPRIIEIHGRLGGYVSALTRRSIGVDLVRIALEIALGREPQVVPRSPRSVEFEYFLVPPLHAGTVRALNGSDALGLIKGVRSVDIRAAVGSAVDWRTGTNSQLGSVVGSAIDHADLAAIIREIAQTFKPVFS